MLPSFQLFILLVPSPTRPDEKIHDEDGDGENTKKRKRIVSRTFCRGISIYTPVGAHEGLRLREIFRTDKDKQPERDLSFFLPLHLYLHTK